MLNNKQTGKLGENITKTFLQEKGYSILETNYSTGHGEIDIIAKERNIIVFIEVKTRRTTSFGYPREAVNIQKQLKIKSIAEIYSLRKRLSDVPMRFDVVEVFIDENNKVKSVSLLKDAFQ